MRISDWISDVCSSDLASQVCRPEFSRLRSLVIVRHPCWSTCRDKSRIRAMGFQCRNSRQDVLPRLSCIRGRQDSNGSATISGIAPAEAYLWYAERTEERSVGKEGGRTCISQWT